MVYGRSPERLSGQRCPGFSEEKDVRVIPKLVSVLEYLETINQDSLQTNSYPDLYIMKAMTVWKGLSCGAGKSYEG